MRRPAAAPEPTSRGSALGPAADLLSFYEPQDGFFFERSGAGVVGVGAAHRVELAGGQEQIRRAAEAIRAALARIARDPGTEVPLAVGGFPFDSNATATLTIPRRAVVRAAPGEATREIGVGEAVAPAGWSAGVGMPTGPDAGEIRTHELPPGSAYAAAVAEAARRIRAGSLRKVVLARSVEAAADRVFYPPRLLQRLRAVDPTCFAFAVRSGEGAVLVGATPELLVRRAGREVVCNPIAGSAPRHGDPERDAGSAAGLLASAKDREEHAIVVEGVAAALRPLCETLDYDQEPVTLGTANVWHLATEVRGRLRDPATTALHVVAALHPTPAVCGTPTRAARELIAELETIDRSMYAGPVGWIDANGDGEWAIALRCAELRGSTARLFAGAGIVADSIPERELDETERKFRALLDSLRWG